MDKSQIEAASDLGANPFQVFTKSIIPQTIESEYLKYYFCDNPTCHEQKCGSYIVDILNINA